LNEIRGHGNCASDKPMYKYMYSDFERVPTPQKGNMSEKVTKIFMVMEAQCVRFYPMRYVARLVT